MKRLFRKSLANRILIIVMLNIILLTVMFMSYLIFFNRDTIRRFEVDSGISLIDTLAHASSLGVAAAEPSLLSEPFSLAMNNKDMVFIAAYDRSGRLIRQSSKIKLDLSISKEDAAVISSAKNAYYGGGFSTPEGELEQFYAPVRMAQAGQEPLEGFISPGENGYEIEMQAVGFIRIGTSLSHINAAQKSAVLVSSLMGSVVLLLGSVIAFLLSLKITRPLKSLEMATRQISDGDLNVSVPISTEDEVGSVALSFNTMVQALQETTVSKDFVDRVLDSMNEVLIVLDIDRRIISLNGAAERLLGYSSSEMKGITVDAIFADAANHPLDKSGWKGIDFEPVSSQATRLRSKDGKEIAVSLSAAAIHDRSGRMHSVVCTAVDMRETNELLEKMRSHTQEMERYQGVLFSMLDDNEKNREAIESERQKTLAAVESMAEGLILIDGNGDVILTNPASKEMLGKQESASITHEDLRLLMGRNLDVYVKDGRVLDLPALTHEVLIGELSQRTIRVEGGPVGRGDQRVGFMLVLRDITRERQLDDAKHDLISNVSHELRTPLAIINNVISNALLGVIGPISDNLKSNLDICQTNTMRLGHIIDNLISISTMGTGQVNIKREQIDLVALIRDTAGSLNDQVIVKKLTLNMNVPEQQIYFYCDPRATKDVLTNLILNAVRYTPQGGSVTIDFAHMQNHIEVSVSDTGIGIPLEEQKSIFEHFRQVSRTYGPGEKGVGLGLSISRHLIERQGGSIGVSSVPGKGSRFHFILPNITGRKLISAFVTEQLSASGSSAAGKTPHLFMVVPANQHTPGEGQDLAALVSLLKSRLVEETVIACREDPFEIIVAAMLSGEGAASALREKIVKALVEAGETTLSVGHAIFPSKVANVDNFLAEAVNSFKASS